MLPEQALRLGNSSAPLVLDPQVVMAAHHKGRLLKYLVGSVTKYAVSNCTRTVLVAH